MYAWFRYSGTTSASKIFLTRSVIKLLVWSQNFWRNKGGSPLGPGAFRGLKCDGAIKISNSETGVVRGKVSWLKFECWKEVSSLEEWVEVKRLV